MVSAGAWAGAFVTCIALAAYSFRFVSDDAGGLLFLAAMLCAGATIGVLLA